MKCSQCQQENPSHAKFCSECGVPLRDATGTEASYADLKAEVESLKRALGEAYAQVTESLEHQTATSEILRVISQSPTDAQPVFDTIVRSAERLCRGLFGALVRFDGELVHFVAQHNFSPEALAEVKRIWPTPPSRSSGAGRAILERTVVQIPDIEVDREYGLRRLSRAVGHRSSIYVPMLRDGTPIGVIVVARAEPGLFEDNHVELLKTFADQAVIAIENVRLFTELQEKNHALTRAHAQVSEALEQQTATGEILGVISSSPTDVQPVLDAVVESAVRLCGAYDARLWQLEGDRLVRAAAAGPLLEESAAWLPLDPELPSPRAFLERRTIHFDVPAIVATHREHFPGLQRLGLNSGLATPLLREGKPIGVLAVRRQEATRFSDKHVELLQTFADQAVIAIENVRLFTELEASNRELTTALAKQTATSDILGVISRSQTDVQPVFDAILASAVRLLGADHGALTRVVREQLEHAASTFTTGAYDPAVRAAFPRPLQAKGLHAQAIRDRAPVNIADVETDPRVSEELRAVGRARGYRSVAAVPLLRHDEAIGTIAVTRQWAGGFTGDEVALLKTFADQAVIAIENVRLFTELQTSNRNLIAALDTQTATSDILRVISGSRTDVQPVFDAIVQSAQRLLRGKSAVVLLRQQDEIHVGAYTSEQGDDALRSSYPISLQAQSERNPRVARVFTDAEMEHISDVESDPAQLEATRRDARERGWRSRVIVPLHHSSMVRGAIAVTRAQPGGFTDDEIVLLQTFADQAVIAIENARLLTELQDRTRELTRSVEHLTALGDVGRAVSSSLDLDTVLTTIVSQAVQLSGLDGGVVFEYDEGAEAFVQRAATQTQALTAAARVGLRKGEGVVGRTALTLEPVQVPDIAAAGAYEGRGRASLIDAGVRALLAVPIVREGRLLGGLAVSRNRPGEFPAETVDLLRTFAAQSALALQNARLFREIEQKSRELEAASQHKSEFLANMSHELRTPLNAIIGYSEMLQEEARDRQQDAFMPDLERINAAAKHQLSLINDILDLSKVEAGRMELDLADFHLPTAIDDALLLMRERASRRGLTLDRHVDAQLGEIHADERKVKQVLLNLLSNAVKFTPEGGRIEVRAVPVDGVTEISVTDTGTGIAPEDREAVFEEFKQVGKADKKAEGTGLGLALCRKFVELHGGRIWVKSQLGAGSTFTFSLPVRPGG